MSISEQFNKIKSGEDWMLVTAVVLSVALGVGIGRLWRFNDLRLPINIIEPRGLESAVLNNQATVSAISQDVVKTVGKSNDNLVGKYVASKNSTKYHLATCPGAKQIKEENKRWFDSKEAAEKAGLTPAANCPGI